MLMSEVKIYCNPGRNWAACWAQRYNCTPELIEETMAAGKALHSDDWLAFRHLSETMKAKGYKSVTYCDDCGSRFNG